MVEPVQMSEKQFDKLLETVGHSQQDHDLLTAIDTKVSMALKNYSDHIAEDRVALAKNSAAIDAAHKRIDKWAMGGFSGIVVTICVIIGFLMRIKG